MARQPYVTRTITTTKAKFLVVNVDTRDTETVEMTLPRTYKDEAAMVKMAQKRCDKPNVKVISVIDTPTVEKKLWGMSEEDFIDAGHELPPRAVKDSTEPSASDSPENA